MECVLEMGVGSQWSPERRVVNIIHDALHLSAYVTADPTYAPPLRI